MKIGITGASGLIGNELCARLEQGGHQITRFVRERNASSDTAYWDYLSGEIDTLALSRLDSLVHLAGESIVGLRWTKEKKRKIRDSRVLSTKFLVDTLARIEQGPSSFVCGSAIGFYGSRGNELLSEQSSRGTGFLSDTVREWENAAQAAARHSVRVVSVRIGLVLSEKGGALRSMLPAFRLGLGGIVGSGRQFYSWISLTDVARAIEHCILDSTLHGAVNAVAPNPVTNKEFTKQLGEALNRPTLIPLPAFVVKTLFGEMGDALLLSSTRVSPQRLRESGFSFSSEQLSGAFAEIFSPNVIIEKQRSV